MYRKCLAHLEATERTHSGITISRGGILTLLRKKNIPITIDVTFGPKEACFLPVVLPDSSLLFQSRSGDGHCWVYKSSGAPEADFYTPAVCHPPVASSNSRITVFQSSDDESRFWIYGGAWKIASSIRAPERCYPAWLAQKAPVILLLSRLSNGHFWSFDYKGNPLKSWEDLGALTEKEMGSFGMRLSVRGRYRRRTQPI